MQKLNLGIIDGEIHTNVKVNIYSVILFLKKNI